MWYLIQVKNLRHREESVRSLSCSGWAPSDSMESAPRGDGPTHLSLRNKQPTDLSVSRTFYFARRFRGSGLRQGTMVSVASGVLAGKTRTAEGGLSAWGGHQLQPLHLRLVWAWRGLEGWVRPRLSPGTCSLRAAWASSQHGSPRAAQWTPGKPHGFL